MMLPTVKTKFVWHGASKRQIENQDCFLDIILHIPNASPFGMTDMSGVLSSALSVHEDCLFIVVQDLKSPGKAISTAMSYLVPFQ